MDHGDDDVAPEEIQVIQADRDLGIGPGPAGHAGLVVGERPDETLAALSGEKVPLRR
jgi:hypothetical protein